MAKVCFTDLRFHTHVLSLEVAVGHQLLVNATFDFKLDVC